MFTNLIRRAKSTSTYCRAKGAQVFQSDRLVSARGYYALFAALMVVSNVWAEDDVVDVDPNGNFTIFGVFRSLWDFLSELIA